MMIRLLFVLVVFSLRQGNALKCYVCDDLKGPVCDDVIARGEQTDCRESGEGHPYCHSLDGELDEKKEATGETVFRARMLNKNCSHIHLNILNNRDCMPFDQKTVNEIVVAADQKSELFDQEIKGEICFCNDYNGCNGSMRPMVALWSIVASLFATVKFTVV